MTTAALRPLSTGEVLDTSFAVYRKWFVPLFTIAVVTRIVPVAMQRQYIDPEAMVPNVTAAIATVILSMVLGAIGIGASTRVVSVAYLGGDIDAIEALRSAVPFIWRLIKVSVLTAIAVFVGFLALIIPSVIVALSLALAAAVMVIEQPPRARDALRRSWQLSMGYRLRILMCLAVPFLIMFFPMVGLMMVLPELSETAAWMIGTILEVVLVPYFYVVIAVLYYDLRVRKEGFDLELLAGAAAV